MCCISPVYCLLGFVESLGDRYNLPVFATPYVLMDSNTPLPSTTLTA